MDIRTGILAALVVLAPVSASAQSAERGSAFADLGWARTWDDEGLLGSGMSLSGGVGLRLTKVLSLQAIVERIAYERDIDYLTFDGRVVFVGAEAAFQYGTRRVRPFWTIGAGFFNDDGTYVRKTLIDPRLPPVVEEPIERHYTLGAMTASGGIDVPVSGQLSVRAGVRFHGLLKTGDDAAPHTIIQPSVGVAWRF
jgi:hypothetical protein